MKCESCGAEIDSVLVDMFQYDGSDRDEVMKLEDLGDGVYGLSTTHNWTGDGLDDDDASGTVVCPKCRQFPFKCKEFGRQEILQLTFWSEKYKEE